MKKALSFDIGGTKIYNATVDENGNILNNPQKISTPKTIEEMSAVLKSEIKKYEKDVDIISIATAGAVNNENTKVVSSTGNLVENYRDLDFLSLSREKVFLENDANAAAWAEHVLGASKNCPNSVMLTLGTGVGGGIILNNRLYKGKTGAAGEMHFKMFPDRRRKCTCGAYDCFEAYASGTALKRTAEEIIGSKEVTTYDVINGLNSKDEKMTEIFNIWQHYITLGIIGLSNLFDPDCFVLSGSMAEFVNIKHMEDEANSEVITGRVKIKKAVTGNYSGLIGAALLALESIRG